MLTPCSVSLVASIADLIVVVSDGSIVSTGPPTLLPELISDGLLTDIDTTGAEDIIRMTVDASVLDGEPVEVGAVASEQGAKPSMKGKLVLEEERAVGRVPKTLILGYIKSLGSPLFIALLVGSSVLLEFASLGNTFFVGLWSGVFELVLCV